MGKLIRNGIEYGGGNGTDIFEVTQAEYDALKQAGTLVRNALYVISDGDNLNPTADDIEYSSGVSVYDKISNLIKYNTVSGTTTSTGAIACPSTYNNKLLSVFYPYGSGISGLVYNRGDGYFTCLDNDRQPRSNSSVTVGFFYLDI